MRAGLLWLLSLGLGCCPLLHAEEALPPQIHIVSEVWTDHTNADGTGLAWDIARKVFEPAGVLLKTESMTYTRSIGLVQRGKADAWIGAYQDEVGGVVFPKWRYDFDAVYALGLASSNAPSLETLSVYRLVWLRGYDYQDQLPNIRSYSEIQRGSGVLDMLKSHRADFYLDADQEINDLLAKATNPELYKVTLLANLPTYFGFASNDRGRKLAALFDLRMTELIKSGELRPIFQRWQQPYPFDHESP